MASIFELPYEDVPQFGGEQTPAAEQSGFRQDQELRAWLGARGVDFRYINDPAEQLRCRGSAEIPWGLCIGSGKSPRGDWQHAVVMRAFADWKPGGPWAEIVHDPHPSRAGLDGPTLTYQCFVLLDPSKR